MRKIFPLIMLAVAVLSMAVINIGSAATLQAPDLQQTRPRLDGITIYFTQSRGEASRFDRTESGLSRFAGLLRAQGAALKTLETQASVPPDADLIVTAGPVDDLSPDETARLWSYLNNNGRLLLLTDPPVDRVRALRQTGGLFSLMWVDMGLRALDNVVLTEGAAAAAVTTDAGEGEEDAAAGSPPAAAVEPVIEFATTMTNADHPLTANLEGGLAFSRSRPLEVDGSIQEFTVTPLVFSDSSFYGESNYDDFLRNDTIEFNIGTDIARGPQILAAAFQHDRNGTRIVVVGDREFATNGNGLQTSPPSSPAFVHPDNARFLINAVNWLLGQDAQEFEFATPGPTPTATPAPTPVIIEADLGVTVSVNVTTPGAETLLVFTVTARNNGPQRVDVAAVSALLPENVIFNSATEGGYNATTGQWTLRNLNPEQEVSLLIIANLDEVTPGMMIEQMVSIAGDGVVDRNTANDQDSVTITVQ